MVFSWSVTKTHSFAVVSWYKLADMFTKIMFVAGLTYSAAIIRPVTISKFAMVKVYHAWYIQTQSVQVFLVPCLLLEIFFQGLNSCIFIDTNGSSVICVLFGSLMISLANLFHLLDKLFFIIVIGIEPIPAMMRFDIRFFLKNGRFDGAKFQRWFSFFAFICQILTTPLRNWTPAFFRRFKCYS